MLKGKNMEEMVTRPWGTYQTILRGEAFQVKKIVVFPKQQLSLQSHKHRSEHWMLVEGEGEVTLNDSIIKCKKDTHIYISIGEKHRMTNKTDKNVVFIEVQNGEYLGEDDIIRYEDIYGRN